MTFIHWSLGLRQFHSSILRPSVLVGRAHSYADAATELDSLFGCHALDHKFLCPGMKFCIWIQFWWL
jgi:hypothetical protein